MFGNLFKKKTSEKDQDFVVDETKREKHSFVDPVRTWATVDGKVSSLENKYGQLFSQLQSVTRQMDEAKTKGFDGPDMRRWMEKYNLLFQERDKVSMQLRDVHASLSDLYEKNPEIASQNVLKMMKDFTGSAPVAIKEDEFERN